MHLYYVHHFSKDYHLFLGDGLLPRGEALPFLGEGERLSFTGERLPLRERLTFLGEGERESERDLERELRLRGERDAERERLCLLLDLERECDRDLL